MFGSKYLDNKALNNLKFYKYGARDDSYVSNYILQPYWSWCVQFFPLWMAPNLITLIGFSFVITNAVLIWYLVPDLVGPGPSWLYFSCAAGMWLYSTFDNVDGKQARRTGTSSPLGELFDHGCDALNCCMGTILQAFTFGSGHSLFSAFVGGLAMSAFYFTTWEEYHTGVMYLGIINGPTEGLVIACSTMVVSGIYGPQIWSTKMVSIVPSLAPFIGQYDLTIKDFFSVPMTIFLVFVQIPMSAHAVYKACKKKKVAFIPELLANAPFVAFLLSSYFWATAPGSVVVSRHFFLFCLTAGIVFGRLTTKIILAYLTKQSFPYTGTFGVWALVGGALLANSPSLFGVSVFATPEQELLYLRVSLAFVSINYSYWTWVTIDRFCRHLNIECLRIPYKAEKKSTTTRKAVASKSTPTSATAAATSRRRSSLRLSKKSSK